MSQALRARGADASLSVTVLTNGGADLSEVPKARSCPARNTFWTGLSFEAIPKHEPEDERSIGARLQRPGPRARAGRTGTSQMGAVERENITD